VQHFAIIFDTSTSKFVAKCIHVNLVVHLSISELTVLNAFIFIHSLITVESCKPATNASISCTLHVHANWWTGACLLLIRWFTHLYLQCYLFDGICNGPTQVCDWLTCIASIHIMHDSWLLAVKWCSSSENLNKSRDQQTHSCLTSIIVFQMLSWQNTQSHVIHMQHAAYISPIVDPRHAHNTFVWAN